MNNYLRKPEWLKSKKLGATKAQSIIKYLREYNLHTVCESAKCPNQGECFERGTATFMILGEVCTRNCTFCAVEKGRNKLLPPDPQEPESIAKLAKKLNLKHIVITTVTRDDLPDGGASQFVKTLNKIREICDSDVSTEVLISDLKGDSEQLEKIIKAAPDILNHNVETVPRLYPEVRPLANYQRSLKILETSRKLNKNLITKSGLMLGLGEKKDEVLSLMEDLIKVGVDILTIGQYMQPSLKHHPVVEYVHPEIFKYYGLVGEKMGFKIVESAPLVRSSYHAERARKLFKERR
ncbi:MAG: lipoyl synthase [Candidatus Cloacimonas sp. 4484_275]|nr:MAG: lipoyl synthase [Candidatus Cloacimonas sp. 4484_275]RLC51225.1 MAG: lipoyl synthase [Candidatus Cloacimonadota bacterium]